MWTKITDGTYYLVTTLTYTNWLNHQIHANHTVMISSSWEVNRVYQTSKETYANNMKKSKRKYIFSLIREDRRIRNKKFDEGWYDKDTGEFHIKCSNDPWIWTYRYSNGNVIFQNVDKMKIWWEHVV